MLGWHACDKMAANRATNSNFFPGAFAPNFGGGVLFLHPPFFEFLARGKCPRSDPSEPFTTQVSNCIFADQRSDTFWTDLVSCSQLVITFWIHYMQINTILLILITWSLKINCSWRKNGKWPNAYTFSKAVAEYIIHKLNGHLSVAIFRPLLGERQICLSLSP